MTGRSVVVTGGASFLGQHLTTQLVADGWEVRTLDRVPPPGWIADLGIAYHRGDVRDAPTVVKATTGAEVVVHAAFAPPSRPSEEIFDVNLGGTANVLDAALAAQEGSRPRIVLVSSTIVGRALAGHPLLPGAPLSRLAAYRASRVAAEAAAARAARAGLPVAVARPKTFVGPGGVGAFAVVFDLVAQGRTVPVLGAGSNRYQLVDVRDLARGLALLAASPATGYFSFGATAFGTVAEDLGAVIAHAGTGARLRFVAPALARAGLRAVELAGLAPLAEWHQLSARGEDSVVATGRARHELGWAPARSNAQALVESYDWYASWRSAAAPAPARPAPALHRALARVAGVAPGPNGADRAGRRPPPGGSGGPVVHPSGQLE